MKSSTGCSQSLCWASWSGFERSGVKQHSSKRAFPLCRATHKKDRQRLTTYHGTQTPKRLKTCQRGGRNLSLEAGSRPAALEVSPPTLESHTQEGPEKAHITGLKLKQKINTGVEPKQKGSRSVKGVGLTCRWRRGISSRPRSEHWHTPHIARLLSPTSLDKGVTTPCKGVVTGILTWEISKMGGNR